MTVGHLFAPLEVQDRDFLITSTIERCPRIMMARELFKNAIEAALNAPLGGRTVDVRVANENGVNKLCIWNTGPGLTTAQLREMTNLASSIDKRLALDENFGMGAKVASLPSNQLGMRYRSCKDGKVSQVIIAKHNGVYGRIRYEFDDGAVDDIIDVTHSVQSGGQDISHDWTEVVLLGNRPEQDTVADPYDGNPSSNRQWLQDDLYHRFYRIPDSVIITMQPGTHKLDNRRTFKTIQQRVGEGVFARHEAVSTDDGIVIHYLYDPPYVQPSVSVRKDYEGDVPISVEIGRSSAAGWGRYAAAVCRSRTGLMVCLAP